MTVTGLGIALELLWSTTWSLLIHGLLIGTPVLALILIGRHALRTLPRRAAAWLWLPLLILVFSPLLPGLPFMRLSGMETAGVGSDTLVNGIPDVISTELIPDEVQVTITTEVLPVTRVVRYSPTWQHIVGLLWLVGTAAMLGYHIYKHFRVRQMCRHAVEIARRGRIRICVLAGIRTPFVSGMLRPRIFLPQTPTVGPREREKILLHEQMHLRRLDVLWRLLWEAALCIYWFQPLLWLSQDAFIADTEGACDEAVLSMLDADRACRADYAQTLLLYAGPKNRGYPTAFGMTEMQGRVYAILHPAGMHAAGIVGLVVVILLAAVVALISPVDNDGIAEDLSSQEPISAEINEGVHTAVIRIDPTSALFGFVDGFVEAHPEIWGATDVTFALPLGWTAAPQTAVFGKLLDEYGTERGTYSITAFSPIDSEDIPPENIPPDERKWQAIYHDLRLSAMQNVADADYHPVITEERFESAVAVMDRAIYEEGVPAAVWKHERVPLVLAFDQDCSMYVQMTFDEQTDEAALEQIAASVAFEKTE